MALGFDKESVQTALAASHNDPDLAVEYLAADSSPAQAVASGYSIDPLESWWFFYLIRLGAFSLMSYELRVKISKSKIWFSVLNFNN